MNKTIEKAENKEIKDKISKSNGKKFKFIDKVKEFISPAHVSINPYELESASADLTSLPSYHYKFKKDYLASFIIRPKDTEELSKVIKLSDEYSIPVTIRAAGTSCFSSSTPANGGAIIDVRRMNKIYKIDSERMTVKVESGISWLNLIESLADYGLAPKCYPTSFKTSCVCGFIATPGVSGIGVSKYGSMRDSINSLVLIRPDGSKVEVSRDSKSELSFDDIIGTYGIYGVISEVELSITTLKTSLEIVGYGFSTIKGAANFYFTLKDEIIDKPFFISLSERNFEKYSHVNFPENEWLVWAVFYDTPDVTSNSITDAKNIASKLNAVEVDKSYLKEKWRDIGEAEVGIGRSCINLIFQEYWISDERLTAFTEAYKYSSKKNKFLTAIYIICGVKGWSRVKIFGLSNINKPVEFFAIKAFFHDLAVKAFNQGDKLYTIGIVNTLYLLKYKPEEVKERKILKEKLDPKDLFNSYRLVKAKMKFWRVSLLFKTAKFLYKIIRK